MSLRDTKSKSFALEKSTGITVNSMLADAYCDGRGNAGTGSCATVIRVCNGPTYKEAKRLGPVTNNIAEYEGVILSLQEAFKRGVTHIVIHSDSQVIVNQVLGKYKVTHDHLRKLRDKVCKLKTNFEGFDIEWIPRNENWEADALCRSIDREPSPRKNPRELLRRP